MARKQTLANLLLPNLSDRQYRTSVKAWLREPKPEQKGGHDTQIPPLICELLLDKILKCFDSKQLGDVLQDYFSLVEEEIWIQLVLKRFEDHKVWDCGALITHIPDEYLRSSPLKPEIAKLVLMNMDKLMTIYIQRCEVDPAVLMKHLQSLETPSQGRDAAEYLAKNHMEEAAGVLIQFISAQHISSELRQIGYEALIQSKKIEEHIDDMLEFLLLAPSSLYNELILKMQDIKISSVIQNKLISIIKRQKSKTLQLCAQVSSLPARRILRAIEPELERYTFFIELSENLSIDLSDELRDYRSLEVEAYSLISPALARSTDYGLISQKFTKFDDASLLIFLQRRCANYQKMKDILRKFESVDEDVFLRMYSILLTKIRNSKSVSREARDKLESALFNLLSENVAPIQKRISIFCESLNPQNLTKSELILLDMHNNKLHACDDFDPSSLVRFSYWKAITAIERMQSTQIKSEAPNFILEELIGKLAACENEVQRYAMLLVIYSIDGFDSDAFWKELVHLDHTVVFEKSIDDCDLSTYYKIRGADFLRENFCKDSQNLVKSILLNEVKSGGTFRETLNKMITENSNFERSSFSKSNIEEIYSYFVEQSSLKEQKQFGRNFIFKNKYGLELLINKAIEGNYHHAEHFFKCMSIGYLGRWFQPLIKCEDTARLDWRSFTKKVGKRLKNTTLHFHEAFECLLIFPNSDLFDYIDSMCVDQKKNTGTVTWIYPHNEYLHERVSKCRNKVKEYLWKYKNEWKESKLGDIDEFVDYFEKYGDA